MRVRMSSSRWPSCRVLHICNLSFLLWEHAAKTLGERSRPHHQGRDFATHGVLASTCTAVLELRMQRLHVMMLLKHPSMLQCSLVVVHALQAGIEPC